MIGCGVDEGTRRGTREWVIRVNLKSVGKDPTRTSVRNDNQFPRRSSQIRDKWTSGVWLSDSDAAAGNQQCLYDRVAWANELPLKDSRPPGLNGCQGGYDVGSGGY